MLLQSNNRVHHVRSEEFVRREFSRVGVLGSEAKLLYCFLGVFKRFILDVKPQSNCSQFQLTVFSTQHILKLNSSPSLVFDDVDHCSGEDLFELLPIRVRRSFLQYCEVWQQGMLMSVERASARI